jgi:carboxypeptidase D
VDRIQKLGVDIDAVGRTWVRAYIAPGDLETLEAMGHEVARIPNQALRMWRSIEQSERLGLKAAYHDYDAVTTYLQGVAADHPSITELISIGQSVEGRELWILKITDNPGVEEDEPEFKYISTMHGDEPVGTENCLNFIDLLTDNHASATPDPALERLVDEVEIWIMPMMNPDGNSAGSRYNAHGVNLNRDFPDWVLDPYNTGEGREPETQAVMAFSDSMSFDLSANFHTGALVVNYPWDNRPERAPDDSLFITMSEAYSIHNEPMWNSPSFYHGITNGYDWYEIHGGMQDWNYDWMHNKEVTIELNDVKWPPAEELPQLWDDNDESMMAYLEWCLRGIRGVVTDSTSGAPLSANIGVEGNAWEDVTDPDVGDYHRLLEDDTYTLIFSCPGYITKQVSGVLVSGDTATVLDVQLTTAPLVTVSGTVTSETLAPLEASVEFCYHTDGLLADSTTSDPADGSYSLTVPVSEYDIEVRAEGYIPENLFADIVGDTTLDFELRPASGRLLVVRDGAGTEVADDLGLLGFEVVEETAAVSDPATWSGYDLVVWSSAANTSPVNSSDYRGNLIDYVGAGGRLLIEGGELAYDAVSGPGYPDFADSVLHSDGWNGDDVGQLDLAAGQASHPLATSPNALPTAIAVSYSGWGSQDAAHPSGSAYRVYGTSSQPTNAGVLVFDGDAGPDHGEIVFFAFAYSHLSDRGVAKQLLENAVTYLVDNTAGIASDRGGSSRADLAGVSPSPFGQKTEIVYFVPASQEVQLAVYDVRGRLLKSLASGFKGPGFHRSIWRGEDGDAEKVCPGVYFCRLVTPDIIRTRKIVKIR